MSKEEILKRLEELEREAIEIKAEQDNIEHLLSLVHGGKLDATECHINKIQMAINARIVRWNHECDLLEQEARRLAA